jgi:hypothetical protein
MQECGRVAVQNRNKISHSWSRALLEKPPNCAATRELPSILWNPEIHHRIHISPLRGFVNVFVTMLFFTVRSC